MLSERCKDCAYYAIKMQVCDYMAVENKRRGCPTGDACDKFKPRDKAAYSRAWYNRARVHAAERMKEGESNA